MVNALCEGHEKKKRFTNQTKQQSFGGPTPKSWNDNTKEKRHITFLVVMEPVGGKLGWRKWGVGEIKGIIDKIHQTFILFLQFLYLAAIFILWMYLTASAPSLTSGLRSLLIYGKCASLNETSYFVLLRGMVPFLHNLLLPW